MRALDFRAGWIAMITLGALAPLPGQMSLDRLPVVPAAQAIAIPPRVVTLEFRPPNAWSLDGQPLEFLQLAKAIGGIPRGTVRKVAYAGGSVEIGDQVVLLRIAANAHAAVLDQLVRSLAAAGLPRTMLAAQASGKEVAFDLTGDDPGAMPEKCGRIFLDPAAKRLGERELRDGLRKVTSSASWMAIEFVPTVAIQDLVAVLISARASGIKSFAWKTHWTAGLEDAYRQRGQVALPPTKSPAGVRLDGIKATTREDDRFASAAKGAAADGPAVERGRPMAIGQGIGPSPYGLRIRKLRQGKVPVELQASVDRGLAWLRSRQSKSGSFGAGEDALGATAVTMLAFTAEGGSVDKALLESAVSWLLAQTRADGTFQWAGAQTSMLDQALATLALLEWRKFFAFEEPGVDLERAVAALLARRDSAGVFPLEDLVAAGWCIEACEFARDFGLKVPNDATSPTIRDLLKRGLASPGDPLLAAAALRALFWDKGLQGEVRETVTALQPALSRVAKGVVEADWTLWLEGSHAQFQCGGPAWREWLARMQAVLQAKQQPDGSVPAVSGRGAAASGEFATAVHCLTLQSCYRLGHLVR